MTNRKEFYEITGGIKAVNDAGEVGALVIKHIESYMSLGVRREHGYENIYSKDSFMFVPTPSCIDNLKMKKITKKRAMELSSSSELQYL